MEEVRLNKYLAQCGICSRREADKLIAAGRVSVNGTTAPMGLSVRQTDIVALDGKAVQGREETVVLAYYKPQGVTCTERDKYADRIVTEEIGYPVRVTYAGRLDKDSEGLLLLSNDGDLIQRMMKGSAGHEKEYIVKTKQEITEAFLQKMAEGVYLRELDVTTRPCHIAQKGKYTFHIILTQGLNRQIRRMCRELSVDVVSLKRIRVINITLDGLQPGEYRKISGEEKATLYRAAETAGKSR
ncbi:pseudouridine synthase [Lachnospiraceae bacterium JLR.KK008]